MKNFSWLLLLGFSTFTLQAQAITIHSTNQNPVILNGGQQLSGITYAGSNLYYAVSDSVDAFFPLNLNIDATSGQITSTSVGSQINITGGDTDLEGIAYNSQNNSVFIVSEANSSIKEYEINGNEIIPVTVPNVYQNIRPNLGLESLSRQGNGTSLWTANEQALTIDGDDGTTENQMTIVRLQKFDSNLDAVNQWAYAVEAPTPPIVAQSSNGVSDMLALPNGELLVLEREASLGFPGFQSRIFAVDFNNATDISSLTSGLVGENFTTVSKTLLWEDNFLFDNFEGITLGPELNNGDYSLILVSDDGSGLQNSVLSLRVSGLNTPQSTPEPSFLLGLGLISLAGFFKYITQKSSAKNQL